MIYKTFQQVSWLLAATVALTFTTACETSSGDGDATGTTSGTTSGSTSGATSGADPLGMVAEHNAARRAAKPTPSPALPDVTWSASIASQAQGWASGCVFNHDSNRGPVGENIFVSTNPSDAAAVVASWAGEVADYDYATNSCSGVCGHYTQIVWRDSTEIGCAFADCDSIQGFSDRAGRLWVCRYSPPGNFNRQKPY